MHRRLFAFIATLSLLACSDATKPAPEVLDAETDAAADMERDATVGSDTDDTADLPSSDTPADASEDATGDADSGDVPLADSVEDTEPDGGGGNGLRLG